MFALQLSGASNQLKVEKNNFGDPIIIVGNDTPEKTLLYKIKAHNKSGKSYFVDIPYENGPLISLLTQKHGFSFYHGDDERARLIKRLDVDIPNPLTDNSGAQVVLTREIDGRPHALFTIEKNQKYAVWPGGMSKPGEQARKTAVRELEEELNIKVSPEELIFLGVLHRTKTGYGATHHQYVFHAPNIDQEITPDGKEVLKVIWAPIRKVLDQRMVDNKPLRDHKHQILLCLHRISQGRSPNIPSCWSLPDFRQQDKPEAEKDPNDTMYFYSAIN